MNVLTFKNKLHIVPNCSDERFEDELVFNSLEEFMNRDKLKVKEVDILEEIITMQQRIKYYLDEIQMFMPRHK
jgi:hypothetical protein